MMDTKEVEAILEERRESFETCTVEDSLSSPVDTERFYRFVSTITTIDQADDGAVRVTFIEPVPGATILDSDYRYTVTVSDEDIHATNSRCEMPRSELITLQQITIVIWSIVTGAICKNE